MWHSVSMSSILPRRDAYATLGTSDIVFVFLMAHFVIFGMSAVWLTKLLKGGLRAYLVFDPDNKPLTYTASVNAARAAKKEAAAAKAK